MTGGAQQARLTPPLASPRGAAHPRPLRGAELYRFTVHGRSCRYIEWFILAPSTAFVLCMRLLCIASSRVSC
eukprot:1301821-Pleurochrysis_carterae.AAC.5